MYCIYNERRRCLNGIGIISARFAPIGSVVTKRSKALLNDPISVYEQNVEGEPRFVYYGRRVKQMAKKQSEIPKFKNGSEEADWWSGAAGKAWIKQRSAAAKSQGTKLRGSSLLAKMNRKSTVQIAIRLQESDLAQARKLAELKGLGYQTLLKMLVHEGLAREARRS